MKLYLNKHLNELQLKEMQNLINIELNFLT